MIRSYGRLICPDKAKPAGRRGRQAMDLDEIAGLPWGTTAIFAPSRQRNDINQFMVIRRRKAMASYPAENKSWHLRRSNLIIGRRDGLAETNNPTKGE
jgi:hypothetical protein